MKLGINNKYALWFSAASLIILVSVLLATIIVVSRSSNLLKDGLKTGTTENFEAFQHATMYNLAEFMRRELFTPLYRLNIERIDRTLKDLRKGMPILSICIADESGRVLTDGTDENLSYGKQLQLDWKRLESTPVLIEKIAAGDRITFQIGISDYIAGYGEAVFSEAPLREAIALQNDVMSRVWQDFVNAFMELAITWTVFIALLAVLMSFVFSRTLARPLIALRDATRRIAGGELDYRVGIRSSDELGDLAASFNQMVGDLQKRTAELASTNETLREIEERLVLAQAAGRVGVFDWNPVNNRFVWTEQLERLFGLAPGALNNTYEGWARLVHPEDLPGLEAQIRQWVQERRTQVEYEYRFMRSDRQIRWMSGHARLSYGTDGRLVRMVGTNVDITDLKEIQQNLIAAKDDAESASWAKSEFLANMSHEMRTPLAGTLGMLNLVLEMEIGGEERELLEMARRSTESLLRLITDLLDFSRLEAGIITLERKPFSIPEVIRTAIEVVSIHAREKGLRLSWKLDESVPEMMTGDEGRLRQVLVNLLGNAVKFTKEGEVEVLVRRLHDPEAGGRDSLLFSVRDTGIGIPPDQTEKIFGKFTQVDASWARKHGGAGLGLALSRQIVEMIGGRIWAESRVGEGSTFYFTHPLE